MQAKNTIAFFFLLSFFLIPSNLQTAASTERSAISVHLKDELADPFKASAFPLFIFKLNKFLGSNFTLRNNLKAPNSLLLKNISSLNLKNQNPIATRRSRRAFLFHASELPLDKKESYPIFEHTTQSFLKAIDPLSQTPSELQTKARAILLNEDLPLLTKSPQTGPEKKNSVSPAENTSLAPASNSELQEPAPLKNFEEDLQDSTQPLPEQFPSSGQKPEIKQKDVLKEFSRTESSKPESPSLPISSPLTQLVKTQNADQKSEQKEEVVATMEQSNSFLSSQPLATDQNILEPKECHLDSNQHNASEFELIKDAPPELIIEDEDQPIIMENQPAIQNNPSKEGQPNKIFLAPQGLHNQGLLNQEIHKPHTESSPMIAKKNNPRAHTLKKRKDTRIARELQKLGIKHTHNQPSKIQERYFLRSSPLLLIPVKPQGLREIKNLDLPPQGSEMVQELEQKSGPTLRSQTLQQQKDAREARKLRSIAREHRQLDATLNDQSKIQERYFLRSSPLLLIPVKPQGLREIKNLDLPEEHRNLLDNSNQNGYNLRSKRKSSDQAIPKPRKQKNLNELKKLDIQVLPELQNEDSSKENRALRSKTKKHFRYHH
ncbi:MAG: hypothetical protein BGO07_00970 [Alphaproteobacteria bacterium 40-19]|nr:MAG: hypothetical protein BGO07_00970 [Alphaproteobacteria bacterium 40-19]